MGILTVTSGGNVGIGTASPQQVLHVANSAGEEGYPGIFIQDPTASNAYGGSLYYDDRGGLNAFKIAAVNNNVETGFVAIDRVSGNVGIGTTNPGSMLDVAGLLRATTSEASGPQLSFGAQYRYGIGNISSVWTDVFFHNAGAALALASTMALRSRPISRSRMEATSASARQTQRRP